MTEHTAYLSLGSNLGQREDNIRRAVNMIEKQIGHVVRQSALYDSEPWGFVSSHPFVNAAVRVATTLEPLALLQATQSIERAMGRTEKTAPADPHSGRLPAYHDRIIDIDILLYDDCIIRLPALQIPHPLMWQRSFVMMPLREIAY